MMNPIFAFLLRSLLLGVGGTLTMDVWALLLRKFGIPSLDFGLLGRWLGHLPRGQWFHTSIDKAAPLRAERVLGWTAHYTIGVSFAALLLVLFGLDWAAAPTLGPALLVGVGTVTAPLFILQPALGAGVASSKTRRPLSNSLKSLVTHTVFGFGLYLTARSTLALTSFTHTLR
jgi:hypothetical protein